MMILVTAIMEVIMIMMMTEMKEEEEEIAMMMKTQEEVEIMADPEKGREAEAGAGIMDQEEEHRGAEGQSTLLLHQKCQV